jgi:hypothetical protein
MNLRLNVAFPKWFFWAFFGIVSIIMIASSIDFPTNGDELEHIANGKANVKFYTSLGKDTSYMNPKAPFRAEKTDMTLMRYYGVFTDVTAEAFCAVCTRLGIDFMDARHIWNVLLGLLGVLFTAFTARLFTKNWWAASIALAIMIGTPFFTGFTYNLSKDIPSATGFIMAQFAIYYIFLHITDPLNKKILATLAIGVCIAIGNRVGGILIYAYTGLFLVIAVYRNRKIMAMRDIRTKALWVIGALAVGHIGGLLFWPYGLVSPVGHFLETMDIISQFPLKMSTYFDGVNMDINAPFWYFIPKYILITTPIIFIAGLVLSLFVFFYKVGPGKEYLIVFFLLLFPGVFPIFYIIYKKAVVLQCWRHFLFVFPPLVVLASLGWFYLMQHKKRWMFVLPVFSLLFAKPVIWMFNNHPYEYTYYNELVGGSKGAFENYELDSYCFGVKNCFKWIADNNDLKKDTLIINCNEDDAPIYYSQKYIKQPVKNVIGGFRSKNTKDWDYGVYNTLFLSKEERIKFFPPENYELVHTEYVDKDVPIYIVLKRKNKLDLMGIQAYEKNDFAQADSLLSIYNKQTDYYANVPVMMEMLAKLNIKHFVEAASLYNTVQQKDRTTAELDYYGGVAYANKGDLGKAKILIGAAIEHGLQDPGAAQMLMQIDQMLNQKGAPLR